MTHKSFIYTATILALAALATSAYATRIFAGSECQIANPTQITGIPDYDFAGLSNDATAVDDLVVVCPVVRDNTASTTGTADFKVRVVSNGSDLVVCTLYSLDEDSTLVEVNTDTSSSNVPVTLDLDVNLSANKGYYNMVCILPPGRHDF